jgi:ligand-binding sensor domain-containing protein
MLRTTAIILLLLAGLAARPQPFPQLHFSQLTTRDGLSCDKASAVTQDADGIIWISTNNGLNRFDGYGFARWFANPDDTSAFPANQLEDLTADKKSNLWLTTASGICRFNTITHKVSRYSSGSSVPYSFRTFDNSSIWFDEKGDPFVVSPDGLFHFTDTAHYTSVEEDIKPFTISERKYDHYEKIVRDRKGGLWAFLVNTIYRLDDRSKKVLQSYVLGKDISIYDMLFDSQNNCWASTWASGILRIRPGDRSFTKIPGDYAHSVIRKGAEWEFNGRRFIVFATNKPSLVLIDETTGKSQTYLDDGSVQDIGIPFVDRQNILWIPTNKGVWYVNSSSKLFSLMAITSFPWPEGPDLSTCYDMREEPSGYWVSRRYSGGMFWYDHNWRLIHGWRKVMDSLGPGYREDIGNLTEAYDFKQVGQEMFITTEWGMMILDLKTLKRTMVRYPQGRQIMKLRTIVPENDHFWWIRSFDEGVFVFDPVARQFTRHYLLPANCADCGIVSANYLLRDRKGRVFVSTNGGFFQYDERRDSFLTIQATGSRAFGNSLLGLAEDKSGLIWVGLDDGICAYEPVTRKIVKVLSEDNSIGPVGRITIDSLQNVWFKSSSGYWCWLRRQDKLIQFNFNLGLPDNDEGFFYTTSNGNVYAGCVGGIIWFHNDRLMQYDASGSVKIMDAFAGGIPLNFSTDKEGTKRLLLQPNQNNLQFDFDVINYDLLEDNLFFYKLAPGPPDWVQLDNGRLSFNALPPGEYELMVRGGNKLTGQFTSTDRLIFTIKPYWYQSWWFKVLVVLALIGVLVALVRLRIRRIRQEAAFRQKITDTELQALRAQMNPHFVFNSLNSIENFIMKNEKWLASDYLNKFARLFRMILHSSRNELVPFIKDMEALQLYVDLEQLRFNNKFRYNTRIDPMLTDGDYRVPSLLIQPYVENAIIHGIGLSKKKDLCVQVSAFLKGEYIHYIIRDNGIGRRMADEVNQMNRPNHHSIGLAITKDRINIFSHQQNSAGSVTITDLMEDNGSPAGTKVEVIIKAV